MFYCLYYYINKWHNVRYILIEAVKCNFESICKAIVTLPHPVSLAGAAGVRREQD